MVTKYQKARREIDLFSKKRQNYESDAKDEMDPNQTNNHKNLL